MDPLKHDLDLPLAAACYPAGFPVHLVTNSRDVLDAAAEAWGMYEAPEFATQPLEIRIAVLPEGDVAATPVFRNQARLFSIVSDPHNHAVCESRCLSGFAFVSEKTAGHHRKLREYFLEAMVYTLLAQRYVVPVHAACVARNGSGVLLSGPSEAGKSTLAFGCARAGWTYVGDDATWLLAGADAADRMAIGRSHVVRFREDAPRVFPELADYVARERPNGKISIEVPLADFPQIRTARRCPVACVVFLDRRPGAAPAIWKIPPEEMMERLLADMPSYEEDVNAMYARTVGRLAEVPSYGIRYGSLGDAIRLLAGLVV